MYIELIDCDPVIEECDHLWCEDGRIGDRWCPRCGGDGWKTFDRSALFTLAHNLAVAGGLCASREQAHDLWDPKWSPGCGWPVPR